MPLVARLVVALSRSGRRAALAVALVLLVPALAGAQVVRKLSGPPVVGVAGDVVGCELSPDGDFAVYRADQEADEVFELYRAPAAGGRPRKLSGPLVAGGDVTSFRISPSAKFAVYLADQDSDEQFELFSAASDGAGSPTRLDGALVAGGDVRSFQISPDSSRVFFLADRDADEVLELYGVPIQGGAVTKLNGPLVAGGDVLDYRVSADGQRVVYRANQEALAAIELYGVAAAGGPAVKLSVPFASEGSVANDYRIDARSSRVFYRTLAAAKLHRVSLEGGSSTSLASEVSWFDLSRDSRWVVYSALPDLYSIPASGGVATRISHPLPYSTAIAEFEISPDSTRVAYSLHGGDSNFGLYSVPIGGGPVHEFPTGAGELFQIVITPDSSRVLYYLTSGDYLSAPLAGGEPTLLFPNADFALVGVTPDSSRAIFATGNLYSVPITGGSPVRLNGPLTPGGEVVSHGSPPLISSDSSRVVFLADQDTDDVTELYVAPTAGGAVVKLNPRLAPGGFVSDARGVQASPDGAHVVFACDQNEDEAVELFHVGLPGGVTTRLNDALVAGGAVQDFRLTPDARRVVYLADQAVNERVELFSVPVAGGAPVRLNRPLEPGAAVQEFQVSPDSARVVYRVALPVDGETGYQLLSVPSTGGDSLELTPHPAGGAGVIVYAPVSITADSSRVVYLAGLRPGEAALHSIPITGGVATTLSPDPVPGGRVLGFSLLPDASGVVYSGDLDTHLRYELYASPIAGGTAQKLNGPLAPGAYVHVYRVSADSSHVVYHADQDVPGVRELYSVRLADLARTRLVPALVAGGAVTGFALSADSSRVVYRADQARDEVYEIFSVPIGGGSARRLNAPLGALADVGTFPFDNAFRVGPDSRSVLYLADHERNDVFELYVTPIDGSHAPSRLSRSLVNGGDVRSFLFGADASTVLYFADQDSPGVRELFETRIGASDTPRKRNAPLVPGGNVSGALPLPGGAVVYHADQEVDETVELYLSLRSRPHPRWH